MSKKIGCKTGEIEANGKCIPKKDIKLLNWKAGVINQKAVSNHDIKHMRRYHGNDNVIKGIIPSSKDQYYEFVALVFNEPSKYGISKGRISKLSIKRKHRTPKDVMVYSYDRGKDIETAEGRVAMRKVLDVFPVVDPEDL